MEARKDSASLDELQGVLNEAISEMQQRAAGVQNQYKVNFDSISNYLEINEPFLLESIIALENGCDTDILLRASEGKATDKEIEDWFNGIRDWKYHFGVGIERYENYQMLAYVA
ncbi:hypothetical protein IIB79_05895 [candidate division KSB1 bacterium]|nr:hypothetical protein [candidate division KSB1 bacterium]